MGGRTIHVIRHLSPVQTHHPNLYAKGQKFALHDYFFAKSVDRNQRHTFAVGNMVYEAECKEVRVIIPDDAKIDPLKNLVSWDGDKGRVQSTAREVFDLARAGASGFRMAK